MNNNKHMSVYKYLVYQTKFFGKSLVYQFKLIKQVFYFSIFLTMVEEEIALFSLKLC